MEDWRPLDWLDSRYEVSSAGRVRSWAKRGCANTRLRSPVLLRTYTNKYGYLCVRLKRRWCTVHRLVLRAFTGVWGETGNHKDGDKQNANLNNLEWATRSENALHAIHVLGKRPRGPTGQIGALCQKSRPVVQATADGNVVRVWDAQMSAKRAGFNQGHISAVCRGERRTHAGFIWYYL